MTVQYDQPAPCTASWLVGYPPFSIVIILSDNVFVNNFSPRSAYVASRNAAKDPVPTIMILMWPSCNAIIEDLLIILYRYITMLTTITKCKRIELNCGQVFCTLCYSTQELIN